MFLCRLLDHVALVWLADLEVWSQACEDARGTGCVSVSGMSAVWTCYATTTCPYAGPAPASSRVHIALCKVPKFRLGTRHHPSTAEAEQRARRHASCPHSTPSIHTDTTKSRRESLRFARQSKGNLGGWRAPISHRTQGSQRSLATQDGSYYPTNQVSELWLVVPQHACFDVAAHVPARLQEPFTRYASSVIALSYSHLKLPVGFHRRI